MCPACCGSCGSHLQEDVHGGGHVREVGRDVPFFALLVVVGRVDAALPRPLALLFAVGLQRGPRQDALPPVLQPLPVVPNIKA